MYHAIVIETPVNEVVHHELLQIVQRGILCRLGVVETGADDFKHFFKRRGAPCLDQSDVLGTARVNR